VGVDFVGIDLVGSSHCISAVISITCMCMTYCDSVHVGGNVCNLVPSFLYDVSVTKSKLRQLKGVWTEMS